MFKRTLITALLVTLITSGLVSAANWYGDVSDSFTTPANWSDYASPNGDLYIRALPIGGVSNDCNLTTPYNNGTTYVVNGGVFQERATTYFSGGTACFQSSSLYVSAGTMNVYPAVPATNNSVRAAGNLYVGVSPGNTGTLTIMPGARVTVKSGSTFTLGGSSSSSGAVGILNLHGHIDFTNLRLNWNGYGDYTLNLYPGCEFYWAGTDGRNTLNAGIAAGKILSTVVGQAPIIDYNSVDNRTIMTLGKAYKATIPSPAIGSTIQNMTTPTQALTLSWTKPLPEDIAQPVTSDVYISTDPNMVIGVTQLAAGISGNSASTTVSKLATYYWRVDSTDPNKAVPLTTGDVWAFNTNNTAPTLGISAPHQTTAGDVALWLPGNTSATVSAVVTDDGYPLAGPVTYQWMDDPNNNGTGTVVSTGSTVDVTYTEVTPGTTISNDHRYRLTVSDGELTTVRTFLVRLFVDACIASARLPGHNGLTGDFSGNCIVDFVDFATFAQNWNACNGVGGLCN